ncbi:MAG: hypothetical protein CMK89_22105 [Pseudomonadales bacterium]|nr:hypothetical protein [Pseudomonadales bacterium]
MHEVLIILSVHRERDQFRAENLIDVLNAVRPDALFLEHSPAEYERFNGLEKKVSELYIATNQVPVIPCGKPFPEKEMLESYQKYQRLSHALETYSSEDYRAAFDNNVQRESLEGFSYLHSNEYGQAQKWLHEEEERIVVSADRPEIYQIFQWWSELQRNRELFIRDSIEKIVLENGYERVVLFIGSEHRNSFLSVTKDSVYSEIKWSCYKC